MKKLKLMALAGLFLALSACSLEGQQAGGCVAHEVRSLTANVSWVDCKPAPGHVLVQGHGVGWAEPASRAAEGAFVGTGIGFAATKIPQALQLALPTVP